MSARRALLDALIDDASLYPPANLAMGPALRAHARDRESAYAFVQGRFVVAASRIAEVLAERDPNVALRLSVILDAPAGSDATEAAIARLAELAPLAGIANITFDALEMRLGATAADVHAVARVVDALDARHAGPVSVWFEPPFDAAWTQPPADVFDALAALRERSADVSVGAKLRTGGLTPNALPSVADVAAFIVAAHAAGIPWKATAGLHHPVRQVDRETDRPMHGFLNIFVAGIGLHAGVIDAARVAEIVAEEDPRAFVLDGAHLAWRDVSLDAAAIVAGRAHVASFGSCSFFEPVDDLRRLGLLG